MTNLIDGLQLARDAVAEVPEWQDISAAPKDGTRVLVYTYAHDTIDMAFFDGARWNTETLFIAPTHWMPLPQPPKKGHDQ